MKGMQKVVWAEGVFLGQQHFQAWDNFQNHQLDFSNTAYQSFNWGVIELQWDELSLTKGRFDLIRFKAIMPNGQLVDYSRDVDGPIVLELNTVNYEEFGVVVAIPESPMVEGVAGYQSNGRIGGWKANFVELPDDHDPSRSREVMLAKPNLVLRSEYDVPEQMTKVKLVHVQKRYEGEYSVDATIPCVCLQLRGHVYYDRTINNLIDVLSVKVRDFTQSRSSLGDVASFSSIELSEFLFCKELVQYLAQLKILHKNAKSHPFLLFQLFVSIHQHSATFLSPSNIGDFPGYEHENPHESFPLLFKDLVEMIGAQQIRPESKVAINLVSPGRYTSSSISQSTFDNCEFYLAIESKNDDVDWVARFPIFCKMATSEKVEMLVASGLSGVTLKHTQRLPQKVRIKSGFEYFEIVKGCTLWSEIVSSGEFSLFCMGEFSDANIDLVAVENS